MTFEQRGDRHLGPTVQQGDKTIAASDQKLSWHKSWMNSLWLPRALVIIVTIIAASHVLFAIGNFLWRTYTNKAPKPKSKYDRPASPPPSPRPIVRSDTNSSNWSGKTAVDKDLERLQALNRYSAKKLSKIHENVAFGEEVLETGIDATVRESIPLKEMGRTSQNSIQGGEPPSALDVRTALVEIEPEEWLQVDDNYLHLAQARKEILNTKEKGELLCVALPAEKACIEALHMITDCLIERYPEQYRASHQGGKAYVSNQLTGEKFLLGGQSGANSLEVAARLAMEDFFILMKDPGPRNGRWHLAAGISLAPSSWCMPPRIGMRFSRIWAPLLENNTSGYLDRFSDSGIVERQTCFVQLAKSPLDYAKLMFVTRPEDFYSGRTSNLQPGSVVIRWETQSFRRLPQSGTILMVVRTEFKRMVDMDNDELSELVSFIQTWSAPIASHRGKDLWGRTVMRYCEKRLGRSRTTSEVRDSEGSFAWE